MVDELEFKPGTSLEEIDNLEREFKKESLRKRLGWSKTKFENFFEEAKEYLNDKPRKKFLRKRLDEL